MFEQRWVIQQPNQDIAREIAQAIRVPHIVAQAMANRGVKPEDAKTYLETPIASMPDPFLLKDMYQAAQRLADAVVKNENVTVFHDFDCDGIQSGSLLVHFGRLLGARFGAYVPHRVEEGYGLNIDAIRQIATEGATLIVTVDLGISATAEETNACRELGVDLLVTDHHTPGTQLPDAYAVVNPLRTDCPYPYKKLAGVGVAFNLAVATRRVLRDRSWFTPERPEPNLLPLLQFVAMGTVADVMDLKGVNRTFVSRGINIMRNGKYPFAGIQALCDVSGVNPRDISAGHIGFRLAPRLNASGRMDTAKTSFNLMVTDDLEEAGQLAKALNDLNRERQEEEERVTKEVIAILEADPDLLKRKTIVIGGDFNPGVIGICASRLVERYYRPTILVSWMEDGKGKGSGRSIKAFHLYNGLCACSEHLISFGGHPVAAGLSVEKECFEDFRAAFEAAAAHLTEEDLQPVLAIDAEVVPRDVTMTTCNILEMMEPFGMGNSRPVFCMYDCNIVSKKVLKEKHLKLIIAKGGQNFNAIGFNMADASFGDKVDVAFTIEQNEFRGQFSLQLGLKGIRQRSEC